MSLTHSPSIITDGLVLCLDAANIKSNPSTGTTWYDISGNGHHATLYGNATFSGSAVDLGTTQQITNYFTIPAASMHLRTTWSVEFWIERYAANTGSIDTIFSGGAIPSNNFMTTYTNVSNQLEYNNYPDIQVLSPFTITDGEPFQLVITCQASSTKIYKNGVQVNSFSASPTISVTNELGIICGQEPDANSAANPLFSAAQCWRGKYYNVKFYNSAMTDNEIVQNFNALRGRFGI